MANNVGFIRHHSSHLDCLSAVLFSLCCPFCFILTQTPPPKKRECLCESVLSKIVLDVLWMTWTAENGGPAVQIRKLLNNYRGITIIIIMQDWSKVCLVRLSFPTWPWRCVLHHILCCLVNRPDGTTVDTIDTIILCTVKEERYLETVCVSALCGQECEVLCAA